MTTAKIKEIFDSLYITNEEITILIQKVIQESDTKEQNKLIQETLRKKYREAATRSHPDVVVTVEGNRMKNVNNAKDNMGEISIQDLANYYNKYINITLKQEQPNPETKSHTYQEQKDSEERQNEKQKQQKPNTANFSEFELVIEGISLSLNFYQDYFKNKGYNDTITRDKLSKLFNNLFFSKLENNNPDAFAFLLQGTTTISDGRKSYEYNRENIDYKDILTKIPKERFIGHILSAGYRFKTYLYHKKFEDEISPETFFNLDPKFQKEYLKKYTIVESAFYYSVNSKKEREKCDASYETHSNNPNEKKTY